MQIFKNLFLIIKLAKTVLANIRLWWKWSSLFYPSVSDGEIAFLWCQFLKTYFLSSNWQRPFSQILHKDGKVSSLFYPSVSDGEKGFGIIFLWCQSLINLFCIIISAKIVLSNIRLGWKGSSLFHSFISYKDKCFKILASGANIYKLISYHQIGKDRSHKY